MWAGRPYQPAPSDHPLTQPEDPGLETEARATERAAFDAAVQEKLQKAEVSWSVVGGRGLQVAPTDCIAAYSSWQPFSAKLATSWHCRGAGIPWHMYTAAC
jgi:hypothetical protein